MSSKQDPSTLLWDKTCFNCDYGSHSSKEPDCVKCFKTDTVDNRWPEWRPAKNGYNT
jgi:hypothetical protein